MKNESNKAPDHDLVQSEIALRRAAQKARRDAQRTHTPLVTFENGAVKKQMVVRERPNAEQ
jgi:hypothetical protein